MDTISLRPAAWLRWLCAGCLFLGLTGGASAADLVQMQNGDRYAGKILSMDTDSVVMQSDVLGKITLPRAKVALLNLGSAPAATIPKAAAAATNVPGASAVVVTNGSADLAAMFRQTGTNQTSVKAIREQYLLDAGPEANAKFDELLGGVMSGKVTINDLRAQAKTAAEQLRGFKRDLGDDVGSEVDGYLSILEHFLSETGSVTNPPAPVRKSVVVSPVSRE
jgi:hypothetical protein